MRLQATDIDAIHTRFWNFYDGVVCGIEIALRGGPPSCEIEIQCKDRDSLSGWSRLRLRVNAVSRFRFELDRTTFEVLSSGIQFVWQQGVVYVVLDAFPDDGNGLPDLRTNTAYVAGESCEFEVVTSSS